MIVRRWHLRMAALGVLGWIIAEALLFYAATRSIGVMATILFMALKGLGGLALFAIAVRTVLRNLARTGRRRGLPGAAHAGFAALGALLILVPGFLAPLLGVALYSPSARLGLLRFLKRRRERDRSVLTLDRSEWREVSARRPRRTRRGNRSLAP